MSPEKRQARVDQNKESLAEMSPEKRQARAEQKRKHEDKMRAERNVKRKLHVRQVTQSREEQINEFRREFTDDELRTMSQSTIPEPNYFHNAQANPNKTLALFWINSGHCFFNSVAGRIPHSSAVPAMTLKGWYEDANLQAKVRLLLEPLDSDDEESDELAQAKQGLTVPARLELEALHGDGVPEVAYGLLDLLRSTDLPDAADHDDAMLVFCQSELFNEQCDAVCERILDQLEVHIKMADESEMPDVRTVLEAALPDQVRGWLHLMREQDLGPELGALLNEIREQKVTKELLEVRLNAFKQRIHMEALLPSCCCCGIRDDYILEKDIECVVDRASVRRSSRATTASDKRVDASAAAVPRDLYAERGPPKSSYVRVPLSHKLLQTLRLTPAEEAEHRVNTAGPYCSVFEDVQPGLSSAFYYLNLGLVDTAGAGGATVLLCRSCFTSLKRKKLPKYSVKAGYDYGMLINMPKLSILEKTLIARYILFGTVVKLNRWKSMQQLALTGHIILFPHDGMEGVVAKGKKIFPWHTDEKMFEYVKVAFIGPKDKADWCLKIL